ncbi:MAG: helix-hairpin-helix domain-containing protein [Zoogloea sp.]|nr:MAG: helix-hairpin-helix domain-containing protein [Zoogloea sp.]
MQPRLDGTSSFSLADDKVSVAVERVSNPRTPDNLSGTLALELWALPAPYQAGEPEGRQLATTTLGSLAGQQAWQDLAFNQALAAHPAGTWYIALLLREWSANGYVTRDFSNFPLPVTWNEASAVAPVEEAPAGSTSPAAKPATKAAPKAKAAAAAPASVSINTATAAELAAVKGLSKTVAAAIVAARPFKSLDELVGVKGMGVKSFDKLKGSLSL